MRRIGPKASLKMKSIESLEPIFGTSPTMFEILDAVSIKQEVANSIWKSA
jgi:hypothetical protein